MGVTYKLKDEVVQFIISQRQGNPLSSCRQLAESASEKFGLNLSKSSVHDVLKESGIVSSRGRKPKDKFAIPQEKKKQIQASLSQVKLLTPVATPEVKPVADIVAPVAAPEVKLIADVVASEAVPEVKLNADIAIPKIIGKETSPEYEEAGKIFLKAALWDLGIYTEENIKESDWPYYLTYSKGIKVSLENGKDFFIDLALPIERCIREAADGFINNERPLTVDIVSDERLFKACMENQSDFKITKISIVGHEDHILFELDNIVEQERTFNIKNMIFVYSKEIDVLERAKSLFFSQHIDNNNVIDKILNLKGFDTTKKDEIIVNLLINDSYENKTFLEQAVETLNGMFIRDGQDRSVSVKIQNNSLSLDEKGQEKA